MVVGMLALPMWPAGGSYSATHGPVTALRAAQAAVLIAWSLTIAVRMLCAAWSSSSTPAPSVIVTEIPRVTTQVPRFVDLALLTFSGVERSCTTSIGCSP